VGNNYGIERNHKYGRNTYKVGLMKSHVVGHRKTSVLSKSVAPVVEMLEDRRLLSAVVLSSVPQGLQLADG
jgi:hypothetical protein